MDNATVIGMVVIGATALIGLFVTVGKPIINLNRTLTRFEITLDRLSKDFDSHVIVSKEEFNEVWDKEKCQDNIISNHEGRIVKLENKRIRKTTS